MGCWVEQPRAVTRPSAQQPSAVRGGAVLTHVVFGVAGAVSVDLLADLGVGPARPREAGEAAGGDGVGQAEVRTGQTAPPALTQSLKSQNYYGFSIHIVLFDDCLSL